MERQKVKSSNIESIGYDEKEKTLEVEFINTGVYQFLNVPKETYEAFIKSESIGHFFAVYIKKQYIFKKI